MKLNNYIKVLYYTMYNIIWVIILLYYEDKIIILNKFKDKVLNCVFGNTRLC